MVKTEELAEKKQPEEKELPKAKISKFKLFFWMIVVLAVVGVSLCPQTLHRVYDYAIERLGKNEPQGPTPLEVLQQEVNALQKQLAQMQYRLENQGPTTATVMIDDADLAMMKERLAVIEKQNLNVINSKADVALVLGLLTRLDKAEAQIGKLTKISDDGALILSATMMVKDTAEKGEPFAYEAEVLDILAKGDAQISASVAEIVKYAPQGIKSKTALIAEFDALYEEAVAQQKAEFTKTWKDRLNSKLNEIIKVKKTKKDAPEFEEDKLLEKAKSLVDEGKFEKAMALLTEVGQKDAKTAALLNGWLAEAQARLDFDKAVSQISAHSLALMKVNYIKGETDYD